MSLLRSFGYVGALIPLVSITLLPALLTKAGPVLERPHRRRDTTASIHGPAWGGLVIRRRWTAVLIAAIVLIALLVPAFSLWWLGRRVARKAGLLGDEPVSVADPVAEQSTDDVPDLDVVGTAEEELAASKR